MKAEFLKSFRVLAVLTFLTGVLYPLAMTGLANLLFHEQSSGSMTVVGGKRVGSELVGQAFARPDYFWPRPSATGYNPLPSSGTNLGPTSQTLTEQVATRRDQILDPEMGNSIPVEMLFASGSGLDPHISPEGARYQLNRVVKARGLDDVTRVRAEALIAQYTEGRALGFIGEPRVNVLLLNIALDSLAGGTQSAEAGL